MYMSDWCVFMLMAFASFRLARLIVYDKITAFLRKPFHEEVEETEPDGSKATYIILKGKGLRRWIGELLSCYWCTGIWCAVLIYVLWLFFPQVGEPLITVLAIAGLAGLIESVLARIMDE
ncbi:membrane protein [Weizmannia acidilactici]|uniref:Membrane protein n=1 Tax=Weizmannia acidilactici TaxID=2607726 RepID=A0A5J4JFQ6_9BACI|nr:DUF1360 domain-containing protein [Weizmannia acidilactici]GER67382.1 membrane protein [Weizmannia acidilactici]GER70481.1 membrane protein [Weizmannia acidilactici]GER72618.1 membrane protein [Weizmannia acidilactici]